MHRPLLLVDGTSYLFRAFHALPPLTTSTGEPTGVVYGLAQMFRRLDREFPDARTVVVYDAPGPNFRHAAYADYKAHRPPTPPELNAQVEPAKALTRALGLPVIEMAEVEADDVIATLACAAALRGEDVLISTPDKDFAQLVDGHVRIVNPITFARLDAQAVREKFGVGPECIADYLALVGDSVDNIPGVPGVGPKTAAKWLTEYGSLDALMARAHEIPGRAGENLRAARDRLPLYRELATVRTNLDLALAEDALERRAPDREALRALYRRFEFRGLLRDIEAPPAAAGDGTAGAPEVPANDPPPPSGFADARAGYACVLDAAALAEWTARLQAADAFAFDLETDSLDPLVARVVGASFATGPGEAAYVPVAHAYMGAPAQLSWEAVRAALAPLLEDPQRSKIGQNVKFDLRVLARHGVALRGARYDTMLESYVLDATATRHDMDSLAARYLGHTTITFKEVAGSGSKQITFDQVPLEAATAYAAEDADVTLRLHAHLWPRLAALPAQRRVYEEIECPLVPVLARIEGNGVKVDAARLRAHSAELASALADLERRAQEAAPRPFNIASPVQLCQVLYEELALPVTRKTPKGAPSTAEDALEELAPLHPLPRLILEHRALAKLKSTYTDKLAQIIHPATGRVHTCYQQAVAATGRLSSSDPNLQNIPVRTPEGRRIRAAFIAEPGCVLLSADYSQIELRIMAHLSGDAGLRDAFAQGADVHRATAAGLYGVALEAVTGDQRRSAKTINFGLIYGMSAHGLARQLGIERGEAQRILEAYFARYPGVRAYMEETRVRVREHGYVETLYGRRLNLPEIRARDAARRQYAERAAINAPMQGSAADLIKLAMIRVDRALADGGHATRMILQVHDELVFEVPEGELDAMRALIPALMTADNPLSVPLLVEVGVGANWDEAH
jgi:DNA polymerase I